MRKTIIIITIIIIFKRIYFLLSLVMEIIYLEGPQVIFSKSLSKRKRKTIKKKIKNRIMIKNKKITKKNKKKIWIMKNKKKNMKMKMNNKNMTNNCKTLLRDCFQNLLKIFKITNKIKNRRNKKLKIFSNKTWKICSKYPKYKNNYPTQQTIQVAHVQTPSNSNNKSNKIYRNNKMKFGIQK